MISLVHYLSWYPVKIACCPILVFLFKAKESSHRCFPGITGNVHVLRAALLVLMMTKGFWKCWFTKISLCWSPDKRTFGELWYFQNMASILFFWRKTFTVQTDFDLLNLERREIWSMPKLLCSLLSYSKTEKHQGKP